VAIHTSAHCIDAFFLQWCRAACVRQRVDYKLTYVVWLKIQLE
jgi:hypothetical protein